MGMQLFAQLSKVDEAKRLVFGVAAAEVPDHSGEIMDYESSKPYFAKWSEEVAKDSGGKSLGNLRAMHGKVAAGKLTELNFNDAAKQVEVCAKVVDDGEWKKVLEGVYTGFSIGGNYVGAKKVEKIDNKDVSRYTASPNELSLVDRPCIPSAKFFEVQKADGSLAKVAFQEPTPDPDEVTVEGTPEQIAELGKVLNENGLNLADALAIVQKGAPAFIAGKKGEKEEGDAAKPGAKEGEGDGKKTEPPKGAEGTDALPAKGKGASDGADKGDAAGKPDDEGAEKAKAVGALRKGVYDCDSFAGVLQRLLSLQSNASYEAMRGGDKAMTAKLGAIISMVGAAFKDLIDGVIASSDAAAKTPGMLALAEQAGELQKAVSADFEAEDADPLLALLKIGMRNSANDAGRIAKIHDLVVELGHACAPAAKADESAELAKAQETTLQKMLADALAPMQKTIDEQAGLIKTLQAQPLPSRVSLRAVSKAADIVDDPQALEKNDQPAAIVDDHGEAHEAATLIKSLHQSGGAPGFVPGLRK